MAHHCSYRKNNCCTTDTDGHIQPPTALTPSPFSRLRAVLLQFHVFKCCLAGTTAMPPPACVTPPPQTPPVKATNNDPYRTNDNWTPADIRRLFTTPLDNSLQGPAHPKRTTVQVVDLPTSSCFDSNAGLRHSSTPPRCVICLYANPGTSVQHHKTRYIPIMGVDALRLDNTVTLGPTLPFICCCLQC
jgi:hypothetical protein